MEHVVEQGAAAAAGAGDVQDLAHSAVLTWSGERCWTAERSSFELIPASNGEHATGPPAASHAGLAMNDISIRVKPTPNRWSV